MLLTQLVCVSKVLNSTDINDRFLKSGWNIIIYIIYNYFINAVTPVMHVNYPVLQYNVSWQEMTSSLCLMWRKEAK